MENENKNLNQENNVESNKKRVLLSQKIRQLLNNNDFLGILPLLSSEDREDFVDIIVENMDERNSKLFWRNLEGQCAETLEEAEKRRLHEDIQKAIVLEDLKRSQQNNSFRNDMNRQLDLLYTQNSEGKYLTPGDKHFLEDQNEFSYNISEQKKANIYREEEYKTMEQLGNINNIGDLKITRNRTIDRINNLIREKQEFISRGGELSNSITNYNQQINQLYSVLQNLEDLENTLKGKSR